MTVISFVIEAIGTRQPVVVLGEHLAGRRVLDEPGTRIDLRRRAPR